MTIATEWLCRKNPTMRHGRLYLSFDAFCGNRVSADRSVNLSIAAVSLHHSEPA
jgi:hypothetical protein